MLTEKEDFQNSTVINGHDAYPSVTTGSPSIRHPAITNSHQERLSTNPTSTTTSTTPSPSHIVRTDTFTRNDHKLFGKSEYDIRSNEGNTVSVSRLPELQSRIPHLRSVKSPSATAMKKAYIPSSSAMQTATVNLESVGAAGDKTYRSRLPVRSGPAVGGSSTTASEAHGSRTSACDEVYLIYYILLSLLLFFLSYLN